jgi:hypothetical protein
MPNSSPRSLTDIQLAAATTGRIVTRDSSGIALVTDALTVPILHHRAQPITSGLDDDVALTVSSTRIDGTDPGMDPGSPAPIGNICFGVRNPARENTPYRWPWYVADDGQMSTGQSVQVSQMRRVDGSIIGVYGPGSVDVRPDGNWSCYRAGNSMHDATTPQPNAYCYGATDRDAADPRDVDGPYSKASGKLKWAVSPSGETWWGDWLVEDPEANRVAKLWYSVPTGNLSIAAGLAATTLAFDLVRPSTAGVGVTQLAFGRRSDGNADLILSAQSGATGNAAVTWTLSTSAAMLPAMSLFSRTFGGTDKATTSVANFFANSQDTTQTIVLGVIPGSETLPGMWLGIDPTAQAFTNYTLLKVGTTLNVNAPSGGSFAWKIANAGCATLSTAGDYVCNGSLTTGNTAVINTTGGTPVRVGWTGTGGEEPYPGIWFDAAPTLANFAVLSISPSVVFNAKNTGTVQIRIANGGGANFSQASTDLDRAGVGITIGGSKIQRAAAAPVAGTYVQGDIVYNTAPAASGFIGWVCVTSGSPGAWKTWGVISA